MKMKNSILFFGIIGLLMASSLSISGGASRGELVIWADGKIWDTIGTPTSFKAPNNLNSLDKIYVTANLEGQRPVAEAAPYERDYNGGRWYVQLVSFTELGLSIHDPDGDGVANFEITSDDQLYEHMALGHLTVSPVNVFFECPLLRA